MSMKTTLTTTLEDSPRRLPTRDQIELGAAMAKRRLHSAIRAAISRAKVSQKDISEALGVNKSSVSRMLASPNNLTIENAGRLLRVADCWLEASGVQIERGIAETTPVRATASNVMYKVIYDAKQPYFVLISPTAASSLDAPPPESITQSPQRLGYQVSEALFGKMFTPHTNTMTFEVS